MVKVQSPWQRSQLFMVGAKQWAISLISGMSVQPVTSHGVGVIWQTAFMTERPLPRNAETGPINCEPARPAAQAEEGAVPFSPVQHAQY